MIPPTVKSLSNCASEGEGMDDGFDNTAVSSNIQDDKFLFPI